MQEATGRQHSTTMRTMHPRKNNSELKQAMRNASVRNAAARSSMRI
jgi:hypothetical protein